MGNESTTPASKCTRLRKPVSKHDYLECIDDAVEQMLPADPTLGQWARNYARNHRYRLAADLCMVHLNAQKDAKILEFGSCPPFLTLALHKLGHDIVGLDLAPERFGAAIAEHSLNIHKIDFESEPLPFADGSFDLVLFNEVFEHLRIDPIATMSEAHRALKTGGTLFLSTPNLRSVRGFWSLFRHHKGCHVGLDIFDEYDKLNRYGHMGHVREYTAREVSKFMLTIGFTIVRTEFRTYGPAVRRRWHVITASLLERGIYRVVPQLSPLFSLTCKKTP